MIISRFLRGAGAPINHRFSLSQCFSQILYDHLPLSLYSRENSPSQAVSIVMEGSGNYMLHWFSQFIGKLLRNSYQLWSLCSYHDHPNQLYHLCALCAFDAILYPPFLMVVLFRSGFKPFGAPLPALDEPSCPYRTLNMPLCPKL